MTESEHGTPPVADEGPRQAAAREAMLADILADLVASHKNDKRAAAAELYVNAGESDVPTLGGRRLGTVKLKNAAAYWSTDTAAWLDYVRAFHPDEIVTRTVEEVNPAFTASVLAEHKAGTVRLRLDTGEEAKLGPDNRMPGVTYRKASKGTLEVKPDPDAAGIVLEWLAPEVAALFGLARPELEED